MSSKKEKNKKYALGGKSQLGNTPTGWLGTIQPGNPFDIMDKENYQRGGKMNGPSHEDGGIPIEVEGGEVIINKTKNNAAGKHEKDLLALNKNPDNYKIVSTTDARKRRK